MTEVRIGVVGTGFIASHFISAVSQQEGFVVSRSLTRRTDLGGIPKPTSSIDELLTHSDVVVECSGDPIWATEVVAAAVDHGIPVVTMNTEFHITTGSAFVGKGFVSEAEGDQPGCLAALHEDAVAMGFEPIVYGNMKGFMNTDPTPEDMAFWGEKQGISLPMVTSFTDGTKVQAEQILVANHFGATIAAEGMLGPDVDDQAEASATLASEAHRLGRPVSDFVVSPNLPHGVFIVATHDDAQKAALEYFKLGPGPDYTIVKNNIFVHLEILKTVKRAMAGSDVLLDNSASPELSLAAVAKRDLAPGEMIDAGIGSFELRGHAVRIEDHPTHIPIGLVKNARVETPVERDQLITSDMLDLPGSTAVSTWWDQVLPSALGQGPS